MNIPSGFDWFFISLIGLNSYLVCGYWLICSSDQRGRQATPASIGISFNKLASGPWRPSKSVIIVMTCHLSTEHLTGHQCRAVPITVSSSSQHAAPLRRSKRCQAPVIENEQIALRITGHQFGEAAVAVCQAQFFQSARQTQIVHAVAARQALSYELDR